MIDEFGRVRVDPTLAVEGCGPGVYAIGDCCNTSETKLGAHAVEHGTTVANNLARELKGEDKVPYKQIFNGMVLTVGRTGGAAVINGWHLPSLAVAAVKGGSLFTPKYWNMMGQKMP